MSQEQYEEIKLRIKKEGLEHLVDVSLVDYRQIKDKKFDRIVSVGMLEHVGKENLEEYFSSIHSLLKDGGISLLHCIFCLQKAWQMKFHLQENIYILNIIIVCFLICINGSYLLEKRGIMYNNTRYLF